MNTKPYVGNISKIQSLRIFFRLSSMLLVIVLALAVNVNAQSDHETKVDKVTVIKESPGHVSSPPFLAESHEIVTATTTVSGSVLRNFGNNFTDDGFTPAGPVIAFGSMLYGVAENGGANNLGTIYKIGTAGGSYSIIHDFDETASNPGPPIFSLTLGNNRLFGVTDETIFTLKTDGSGYKVLFRFNNTTGRPNGSLTFDGTALFGINVNGGAHKKGSVYRINTDGTGFTVLHSFASDKNDGIVSGHYSPLTLDGAVLYGMTHQGGTTTVPSGPFQGYGTIFKIGTDGKGYKILHSFYSFVNDGANPDGPVAVVGSTVYGTTHLGGRYKAGVVCRVGTNGLGYKILHEFGKDALAGAYPDSLLAVGSSLYGTSKFGGASASKSGNGDGTVFRMQLNGSRYEVIHSFGVRSGDGKSPNGPLSKVGGNLYGTTSEGGRNTYNTGFSYQGTGTVFKIQP